MARGIKDTAGKAAVSESKEEVHARSGRASRRARRCGYTRGRGASEGVRSASSQERAHVIDLGAPRQLRRVAPLQLRRLPAARPPYTPNPRLYPGPAAVKKARRRWKRPGPAPGAGRVRRLPTRRPVPNARLYRPATPHPLPTKTHLHKTWPPPTPAGSLETASRVALLLSVSPTRGPRAGPAVAAPPLSANARARSRRPEMEPSARHSTSPEDCSDGNDSLSAPSEFLSEFLSAIMRRQYAEALKYCRLILQYEPNNATARGFYPLLQHKLRAHRHKAAGAGEERGSSPDSSARSPACSSSSRSRSRSRSAQNESAGESGAALAGAGATAAAAEPAGAAAGAAATGGWAPSSWEGSEASQSSLELDSCSGSSSSSRPGSPRRPRAGPTAPPAPSGPPSPACAPSPTHSPPDPNGNHPPRTRRQDDLDNDNDTPASIKTDATLRRLRAHFACSIK